MKADTICGLNAVSALFARRQADVLRLFYAESVRSLVGAWCGLLAKDKRPYRMLPPEEMARVAGTPHHGGVCAVAKPRRIENFNPEAPPEVNPLLILDGVGNPHNLGAIARSAAYFGVRAMLIHDVKGAAMPSDAAYRTAEGGLEMMDLYRTRDLPGVLTALGGRFRTVATTLAPSAMTLSALPRDRNIAIVLGNEEYGVSPHVLAACRRQVRIEGGGRIQSMNVAQAASVLLYVLTAPSPKAKPAQ